MKITKKLQMIIIYRLSNKPMNNITSKIFNDYLDKFIAEI